jgi:hypothetical protein
VSSSGDPSILPRVRDRFDPIVRRIFTHRAAEQSAIARQSRGSIYHTTNVLQMAWYFSNGASSVRADTGSNHRVVICQIGSVDVATSELRLPNWQPRTVDSAAPRTTSPKHAR